jgi:hypothetical protein
MLRPVEDAIEDYLGAIGERAETPLKFETAAE